jgi:NAD(P)-dependent dehydrogenase (short-subunit alcohol dehydrogenase family)
VKTILAEHDYVDMLVDKAGRSFRRSVGASLDGLRDYERCMSINYFAALRLTQALVPSMQARQFDHIVNVSSTGAQANPPCQPVTLSRRGCVTSMPETAWASPPCMPRIG